MTRVAGLVLAAGQGSRLGGPKALVELNGERLADRAARVLREGGCEPVYVVSGAAPVDVAGATTVVNDEWATGMASSLRAGLAALSDTAEAVVISLVDQPGIGSDVVARLVRRLNEGHQLVVATYDGQPRNPVGVVRQLWAAASASAVGDEGLRPFIRDHPDQVEAVECADIADPTDIDTPEDLASHRREDS